MPPLVPYGTVLLTEKHMQVFEYCIPSKFNQFTHCIYFNMLIMYVFVCSLRTVAVPKYSIWNLTSLIEKNFFTHLTAKDFLKVSLQHELIYYYNGI